MVPPHRPPPAPIDLWLLCYLAEHLFDRWNEKELTFVEFSGARDVTVVMQVLQKLFDLPIYFLILIPHIL